MPKSAREMLTQTGLVEVLVQAVHQIGGTSIVLRFLKDEIEYEDLFNVESEEVMQTLLLARAGKTVLCTVAPDSTEDRDSHPSIDAARVIEDQAEAPAEAPAEEVVSSTSTTDIPAETPAQ